LGRGVDYPFFNSAQYPYQDIIFRLIPEGINYNNYLLGVNVHINEIKEESLARGATLIKNIPAGRTNLSVDATADFGKFTVSFDAAKGKTYFIEISPRYETFGRSLEWSALSAILSENTGPFKATITEIR
jgi:hypothetical protein